MQWARVRTHSRDYDCSVFTRPDICNRTDHQAADVEQKRSEQTKSRKPLLITSGSLILTFLAVLSWPLFIIGPKIEAENIILGDNDIGIYSFTVPGYQRTSVNYEESYLDKFKSSYTDAFSRKIDDKTTVRIILKQTTADGRSALQACASNESLKCEQSSVDDHDIVTAPLSSISKSFFLVGDNLVEISTETRTKNNKQYDTEYGSPRLTIEDLETIKDSAEPVEPSFYQKLLSFL